MADSTIDPAIFRELQETAGVEFVVDLVDTFLEEAPVMLRSLRDALAARDAEKFRRVAHSLKSNGLTFGALGFAAMARELELGGLDRAADANAQPVEALAGEYARVAAALTELRNA